MNFPETLKLPESLEVKELKVRSSETALLVVDVQNDFANPSGKLYAKGAEKIIKPIRKLASSAREHGATVIYTQDWHLKDDPEFKIWGEHTLVGTWGAEVVDELRPGESDVVVRKPSYDAFYSTPLDHVLRSRKINTLILTGLLANICILCTAMGAAVRGYRLIIPVDAIFAIQEFDYVASLRLMSTVFKAELTTSDGLRFEV